MKSILLIIPSGGVGGIERLALNFYNFYKSQQYEVKVVKIISQKMDIINFGDDEVFLSAVDLSEMQKGDRLKFYIKAPFLLRKIILKYKVTHSIAFGDVPNLFSSLTLTREQKIVSLHGLKSVEYNNNTLLNKLSKLAFKTSFVFVDKVVCISKAIKEDLEVNFNFIFKNKLKVIYNPHDIIHIENLSVLPFDEKNDEKIFEKKTIVFLGRLTNQKAPWHLIKSFSLIANKEDINLVFIGDGVESVEKYICHLIAKFNLQHQVFFLGRKSNPYKYLKRATVLALSSYYEGTPNVIVEAIANEIPIVSSNCTGGILELMSYKKNEVNENLIITEAGIITPNFFKTRLDLPENDNYIEEEYIFAKALEIVMHDDSFKKSIMATKFELLQKYNLEQVANEYLL